MRRIVLFLGVLFAIAALAVLAMDLAGMVEGSGFAAVPAGQLWYDIGPGSLNLTQAVIERYIWVPLWDPALLTILQWPATLVLAIPGVVLLALALRLRRRREPEDAEEG